MPTNLSRDERDQGTERRLTRIKGRLRIHLQITPRAACHLLAQLAPIESPDDSRDVIKAERSTRTDRVKLEETGEAGREIMKMSAPRFRLGSGLWLDSCLSINR